MTRTFHTHAGPSTLSTLALGLLLACGSGGAGPDVQEKDIPTVVVPKDIQYLEVGQDLPVTPDPGVTDPGQIDDSSIKDPETGSGEDVTVVPEVPHDPGTCIPKCDGKDCGNDGCGGKCGTCPGNHECIAFTCICVPDCADRECGDNGCDGTCGPGCPTDVTCLPWGKCAKSGPCSSSTTLSCASSTSTSDNGWSGNSDVMDVYSCSGVPAHGPERSYLFVPDQSGDITIELANSFIGDPPDFLNVYLVEDQGDGCSANSCVAWNHTFISAAVEAGRNYWILVDAVENDSGGFYLDLDCSWYVPSADP